MCSWNTRSRPLVMLVALFVVAFGSVGAPWASAAHRAGSAPVGTTTWVSANSFGVEDEDTGSQSPAMAADGRFVAFTSASPNLVPGDTNGRPDVFVWDRVSGATQRVSLSSAGGQGNGSSGADGGLAISAGGRFVAFPSAASNLVADDTNGVGDVFVRDVVAGVTTRVSVSNHEEQGDRRSEEPALSRYGRFVAFSSKAAHLVGDDTSHRSDVFVRDLTAGTTRRVSVNSHEDPGNDGSFRPTISQYGRFVAFHSPAGNFAHGDIKGSQRQFDVFVRDRRTGTTTWVSVSSDETGGNSQSIQPSISANGRYVVFSSDATNLVPHDTKHTYDVYIRDRHAGTTRRISIDGGLPEISADGRFVAFYSYRQNVVPHDTNHDADVFVRDRATGKTTRVSVNSAGVEGNQASFFPGVSRHGRYIAFESAATNLAPGDITNDSDVFLRHRAP